MSPERGSALHGSLLCRLQRVAAAAALGTLLGVSGCASPATYLRDATSTAVDSTLASLDTAESRQRLKEIFGAVDVQTAAREMTKGVLEASASDLSRPEVEQRIQLLVEHFVEALTRSASRSIDADLGPAARRQMVLAITEALAAGTSPDARARMSALAAAVAESAAHAFGAQLPALFGPEMRATLQSLVDESLAPAMAVALDKVAPSVANVARLTAREALAGVNDELAGDLGRTIDAREDKFWAGLGRVLSASTSTAREWLYVATTVAAVLLAGLIALAILFKKATQGRQAREDAVTLLTASIHGAAASGGPGARDVLDRVAALHDHPGAAYLNEFLARNPHMRVSAPSPRGSAT